MLLSVCKQKNCITETHTWKGKKDHYEESKVIKFLEVIWLWKSVQLFSIAMFPSEESICESSLPSVQESKGETWQASNSELQALWHHLHCCPGHNLGTIHEDEKTNIHRTSQELPALVHNSVVQKYSEDTKFLTQYQNDQKARTMIFPKEWRRIWLNVINFYFSEGTAGQIFIVGWHYQLWPLMELHWCNARSDMFLMSDPAFEERNLFEGYRHHYCKTGSTKIRQIISQNFAEPFYRFCLK